MAETIAAVHFILAGGWTGQVSGEDVGLGVSGSWEKKSQIKTKLSEAFYNLAPLS